MQLSVYDYIPVLQCYVSANIQNNGKWFLLAYFPSWRPYFGSFNILTSECGFKSSTAFLLFSLFYFICALFLPLELIIVTVFVFPLFYIAVLLAFCFYSHIYSLNHDDFYTKESLLLLCVDFIVPRICLQ
jgi:hypothetical protein